MRLITRRNEQAIHAILHYVRSTSAGGPDHGFEKAIASRKTSPNPSPVLGKAKKSAPA